MLRICVAKCKNQKAEVLKLNVTCVNCRFMSESMNLMCFFSSGTAGNSLSRKKRKGPSVITRNFYCVGI
jgi:hypothetical protein